MKLRHWIVVGTAVASASAFAAGDKQQRTQGDQQPQRSSAAASQPQAQMHSGQQQHAGAGHSQDQVRQVQEKLSDMGYDVGPVDGIVGPKTQAAVKEFQQDKGLQATGQLNSQTLAALQTGDASSSAAGSGRTSGSATGRAGSPGQAGTAGQPGTSMSQDRSSQSSGSQLGRDAGSQPQSDRPKQ